jgi:hypothetical protein
MPKPEVLASFVSLLKAGWTVEVAMTGDHLVNGPQYTLIMCDGRATYRVIGAELGDMFARAAAGQCERVGGSLVGHGSSVHDSGCDGYCDQMADGRPACTVPIGDL